MADLVNGIRSIEDGEALVLGLGMYATGGGGLAERGMGYVRKLMADGIKVEWVALEELQPDTLTCSVYGMGSIAPHPGMTPDEREAIGVVGEIYERPWVRAVDRLEGYLGERIGAVVPFELGPSNTLVAVDAAARTGRSLVDGDYIGRALPKMSQALPAVLGLKVWPLTICDPWGSSMVLDDCPSPQVAERIGKMISRVTKSVDMGASCSHAAFPNRVGQIKKALVPGTLTKSLEVGRSVLAARRAGTDPIEAAVDSAGGAVLFRGVVSDRVWEDSADGYMEGITQIKVDRDLGESTGRVWFQNEHHLAWLDDVPVALSPDVISIVESSTAEPISNTELARGMDVTVLGFPSTEAYRQGAALDATGPRHYGYDIDWVPIERLNPELFS